MRRLLALLLGVLLLWAAGCAPAAAPDETPDATLEETPGTAPSHPSDPSVHTDWSQLTPYEPFEAVGSRLTDGPMDELVPSEGYGLLVPYTGGGVSYQYQWDESGATWQLDRYGLATLDGVMVTDPVYDGVYQVTAYREDLGEAVQAPFWQLTRTVQTENGPEQRCAVAALDGSWCTDFRYEHSAEAVMTFNACEDGIILADLESDCIVVLDAQGRQVYSLPRSESDNPADGWWSYSLLNQLSVSEGILLRQFTDEDYQYTGAEYLRLDTGEVLDTPELRRAYPFLCGRALAQDAATGRWGYLDTDGSWAIQPVYTEAKGFINDLAVVSKNGERLLIDREGNTVAQLGLWSLNLQRDGPVLFVDGVCWVDGAGTVHPLEDGPDYQWCWDGVVYYNTNSELVLLTPEGEVRLPYPGTLDGVSGRWAVIFQQTESGGVLYRVVDRTTGQTLMIGREGVYLYLLKDSLDPDSPVLILESDSADYAVYTPEGELLFRCEEWPTYQSGLLQVKDTLNTGLRDADGNWVLRLSRFGVGDD